MAGDRPAGFIHIDLDGAWTLAACYGFPEQDLFARDPVFERGMDRLLAVLREHSIFATFFIVGRDTEIESKRAGLAKIAAAGHELAVHGWSHRFDLELMPESQRNEEIERTRDRLAEIDGKRPVGFRAPGYAAGPRTLASAARAGLLYDGSSLPTPWRTVLRGLADRLRRRVERETNGHASPGFHEQYGHGGPTKVTVETSPHGGRIWRLPLAVWPTTGLPLQASFGMLLGEGILNRGLGALASRGEPVTWLLHGMDAVGGEDLDARIPRTLARQRYFRLDSEEKIDFLRRGLTTMTRLCELQRARDWVEKTGDDLK